MNGIGCSNAHLSFDSNIHSSIKAVAECVLDVGMANLIFTLAQQGEHNIAVTGKGVGFYTDRAGGYHSQYLGVVKDKIGIDCSPRTLKRAMSIVASGNQKSRLQAKILTVGKWHRTAVEQRCNRTPKKFIKCIKNSIIRRCNNRLIVV